MNKALWSKCVQFHGHECPGLAIGFRACEVAVKTLNLNFSVDEELVCVTENDACGVDAIQVITGCTLGKGNLIYKNIGKMAFTFFSRKNGNSIRVIFKPLNQSLSKEEKQNYILSAPIEKLFIMKTPNVAIPKYARIFNTIICETCGEGASENKIRINNGKHLCLDCFKEYERGW